MDNKKLGGTKISTLRNQESNLYSKIGSQSDSNLVGYHKIEKGANKHRLYPAHPGTESFIYASVKYFLPFLEDGKEVKRPVFNSKIHGDTEKDIVEEYVKWLQEKTLSDLSGSELDKALKPIMYQGAYNLIPKTEWVAYSDKYETLSQKTFGRLAITNSTKIKIEKLSQIEDSDEVIATEPFTDEEDGIAIIINYNPDAVDAKGKKDLKNYYSVELEERKVDKFRRELIPTPLSKSDVENFLKQTPLEKLFKNCYGMKDFNLAIKGLSYLDKVCKFNVFKDSGFLEIVEEIKGYYPEVIEEKVENCDPDEVEESNCDLNKMNREELKQLIIKEFGQGVIIIKKSYTEDDIRDLITAQRELSKNKISDEEEEVDEVGDLPWEKDEEVSKTDQTSSLEKMREKLRAKSNK